MDIIWFGLTQRQEARLGFDLAAQLGGRILILQFKASDRILSNGRRRFVSHHDQMVNLRRICRSPRAIYYVLPDIGVTADLHRDPCVLPQSWFLDVSSLPASIPVPTTGRSRRQRKSGLHYIDLDPAKGDAVVHSEPISVKPKKGSDWIRDVLAAPKGEVGVEPSALQEVVDEISFQGSVIAGIVHERGEHF